MANTHSINFEKDSSQYLMSDTFANFPTGNAPRTIAAWVKLETDPDPSLFTILNYGERDFYKNWSWAIQTGRKQLVGIYGETSVQSNTAIPLGTWTHIAITYDGTTLTFYINGVADGTHVWANTPNTTLTHGVYIGALATEVDYFFDGKVDDVRVWNDVRTQPEIANNKDKELIGNEAGLVSYWKLNNSLLDETANNNDLDNYNAAVFDTDVPFTGIVGFSKGYIF